MRAPLFILVFALAVSACAGQQSTTVQQNLRAQIAEAEQDLERLKQSYTVFHPAVIVAEREVWQLESQLPSEARTEALQARLNTEREQLGSSTSRAESDEDATTRLSRDKVRYLEELLAGSAD